MKRADVEAEGQRNLVRRLLREYPLPEPAEGDRDPIATWIGECLTRGLVTVDQHIRLMQRCDDVRLLTGEGDDA